MRQGSSNFKSEGTVSLEYEDSFIRYVKAEIQNLPRINEKSPSFFRKLKERRDPQPRKIKTILPKVEQPIQSLSPSISSNNEISQGHYDSKLDFLIQYVPEQIRTLQQPSIQEDVQIEEFKSDLNLFKEPSIAKINWQFLFILTIVSYFILVILIKESQLFLNLLIIGNSFYKQFLKQVKCFSFFDLKSKRPFSQKIAEYLIKNPNYDIFEIKEIQFTKREEFYQQCKEIRPPVYKWMHSIDFKLFQFSELEELIYLSKDRLDVKLQISLTVNVIQKQFRKEEKYPRHPRSISNDVESSQKVLVNRKKINQLKDFMEKKNREIQNESKSKPSFIINMVKDSKVLCNYLFETFKSQFCLNVVQSEMFSQFLLVCELSHSFLKNEKLIVELRLKEEDQRLQILLGKVLFFNIEQLQKQYKFMRNLEIYALRSIVKIIRNDFSNESIQNIQLRWNDFQRFWKFFFLNEYWTRKESILFMMSIIDSWKSVELSLKMLQLLFLNRFEKVIQLLNTKVQKALKSDVIKLIMNQLTDKDLFEIVKGHLQQTVSI